MNLPLFNSNPHYARLGEDEGIRKLVDRFYDLMDEDPDYPGIPVVSQRHSAGLM